MMFESSSGEVYLIQHYVVKCVSDLRMVGDFLDTPISSTNKTGSHDITEILLKVALNTITLTTLCFFSKHTEILVLLNLVISNFDKSLCLDNLRKTFGPIVVAFNITH
jgi:hypothetical protein